MGFLGISAVTFIVAFALQWIKRWWLLSVLLPTVGFVALILFDEFVLPYREGGASMWPLALLFGVPITIVASLLGVLCAWLSQPERNR